MLFKLGKFIKNNDSLVIKFKLSLFFVKNIYPFCEDFANVFFLCIINLLEL